MPDHLLTRWGRALDPDRVLPEYPRPQLVRDSYLNLNGRWEIAFRGVGHTYGAGDSARVVLQDVEVSLEVPFRTAVVGDKVIVGNEVLLREDVPKARLLQYLGEVRAAGTGIPVTTAEKLPAPKTLLDTGDEQHLQRAQAILRKVITLQDQNPGNKTFGIWSWFAKMRQYLCEFPLFKAFYLIDRVNSCKIMSLKNPA